jgi:putative FmdB family regulatory protein
MPLYEYECDACGQRFEMIQKFSDAPPDACRVCGKGPVRRLLSSPAIQFKGSGWYITDYAKKGSSDAAAPASGKTGDAKGGETKSDSAAAAGGSTAKSDAPASTTAKPTAKE